MGTHRHSVWRLLGRLWPWLLPHRRQLGVAGLLLCACTALFQCGPLVVRHIIDVDVPQHDMRGLYLMVAIYVLAQAGYLFCYYHERMLLEGVGLRVVTTIKARLSRHLLSLQLSFFDAITPGKLLSRVESDGESLRQLFSFTAINVLGDLFKLSVSVAVMYSIQRELSLVVLAALCCLVAISISISKAGRRIFLRSREQAAEVSGFLEERLQAVPVIQAYQQQESTLQAMDRVNHRKSNADVKAYWLGNGIFNTIVLFEVLGLSFILWVGGRLALQSAISVGTLLLYLEYYRRLFEPVYRLGDQLNVVVRALASGERVFELLDLQPGLVDPPRPCDFTGLNESIEFRHVGFAYAQEGREVPVLHDVTFKIPRGERWALVGSTGGGKSSIVSLLLRFYEAQQGAVLLDGVDVRELRTADIRRRCALVMQDVVIFPGTVEDNVTLGETHIERARVEAALRTVGLEALLARADATLINRGANLSSGERQLLSFARAVARDADILILDEATASIDPATEAAVTRALRDMLAGRTAIIIAHRLSTIVDADRILVIEHGRIVEQGTHPELLRQQGVYARLHASQGAAA